ncbi:hypothetical protein RE474_06465 [Methanolobus sediminis]|uniref:Uncharacterized protein n=1 Tax=Methanolobus sediminis TaxID=3072978 RepID=A0AA51YK96_9EURY|nr:hypothetical protein [Methanolobus sediminis]WMW26350.1 hypothetical protein RE474_06465 [Methanolobus sediminis]
MVSEDLDLLNDDLSADRILSFVNVLKIVSKTDEFKEWMNTYHHLEVDDDIFVGYKFFMSVCIRGIINSVIYEDSLGLDEDFTFFRARFVGVDLEDIPNTCEKTIFIKSIWPISRQIKKAKNWEELHKSTEPINELIFLFDKFFEENISETEPLDKFECLKIVTIIYTHIFLNDTSEGIPHIYRLIPILKTDVKEQYMSKAYLGYVYTLQYLWFILLGEQIFKETSLKELHEAHILYSKDVAEEFKLPFELSELESVVQNQDIIDEDSLHFETLKKWFALDRFFGKINEEIVSPIKEELKIDLIFHPLLSVKPDYDKKLFEKILLKDKLSDPTYLKDYDNDKLTEKRLNYRFFWYDVNVLDSQEFTLFNGLPSFISTLLGTIESSKIFAQGDIVSVLKFKHPVEGAKIYDYSYAILIHASSGMGISDYSGWLVFYDCASDSGSSELLFLQAEDLINTFVEGSKIELQTEIVDKEEFKKYLLKKDVSSSSDELSLSEVKTKVDIFTADAKGKLFEYAFCNWLFEHHSIINSLIKFDVQVNNEQIDAYEEFEDRIELYECKVQLHTEKLDDIINQVQRKVKALPSDKKVIRNLVIYMPCSIKDKNELKKAKIYVHDDFKANIFERLNPESKKKLSLVLEFKINQITEKKPHYRF